MPDNSRSISQLALVAMTLALSSPAQGTAQNVGVSVPSVLAARDTNTAYRLDLINDKLEPVSRSDLKAGYIYYHFSPRLNRWAWSYYQADGSFWYALGEGSIQEGRRFDVPATQEQVQQRLKDFPQLHNAMETYGTRACFTLQADGRWRITGAGIPALVFNAETGELWQAYGNGYIPVVHTGGRVWTVRNGRHYPAGSSSSWE